MSTQLLTEPIQPELGGNGGEPPEPPEAPETTFVCGECGREFKSAHGRQIHVRRTHVPQSRPRIERKRPEPKPDLDMDRLLGVLYPAGMKNPSAEKLMRTTVWLAEAKAIFDLK